MELVLQREASTSKSTPGRLEILGDPLWLHTLELPLGDGLPGSAIPPGMYLIMMTHSPKFSPDSHFRMVAGQLGLETLMPEVVGIPNRSEIRIHWGNVVEDTDGCILIGETATLNFIGASRDAFASLWPRLMAAHGVSEPITLRVRAYEVPPVVPDEVVSQSV